MTRKKKKNRDQPAVAEYMTASEAARVLGISASGVKIHDAKLQPIRTASGTRLYATAAIEAFRKERAEKDA